MKTCLVVTTIAQPTSVLQALARGCSGAGWEFIIIGDRKSPAEFQMENSQFYSLDRQKALGLKIAGLLPVDHYARKNVGYLIALSKGASFIVETDDDSSPLPDFFERRQGQRAAAVIDRGGCVNVYRYFTDDLIWPRGLPLDSVHCAPKLPPPTDAVIECPIQQGLIDDNPDVDAIYRLILPLPLRFTRAPAVALGTGSWCPFNSQNTSWTRAAAPLLYLPSYCSFRVTDIWRSFIAQRIAWEHGWRVLYHGATMRHERNHHDLMQDFVDENPSYLHNPKIIESLGKLSLHAQPDRIGENLLLCYEQLVADGIVDARELVLCRAWLDDIAAVISQDRNKRTIGMSRVLSQ
jgi:hypothetical protein